MTSLLTFIPSTLSAYEYFFCCWGIHSYTCKMPEMLVIHHTRCHSNPKSRTLSCEFRISKSRAFSWLFPSQWMLSIALSLLIICSVLHTLLHSVQLLTVRHCSSLEESLRGASVGESKDLAKDNKMWWWWGNGEQRVLSCSHACLHYEEKWELTHRRNYLFISLKIITRLALKTFCEMVVRAMWVIDSIKSVTATWDLIKASYTGEYSLQCSCHFLF